MAQIENFAKHKRVELTLDATLADSPALRFEDYRGGRVYIPDDSDITSIEFYDAAGPDDDFLPAFDDADTPAALAIDVEAGNSYPIPAKLFAAGLIKMLPDADGDVVVSLKS